MKSYQHHIRDFNNATRHLTRVERSIYRDLIELYYEEEAALPKDVAWIARKVLARTNEELTAVEQVLNEFFTESQQGYYHERCEAEIEKFKANSSSKALAGKASAEARARKKREFINNSSTDAEQTLNSVESEGQQNPTNHKPLTINHKPNINTTANAVDSSEPSSSKPPPDDSPIFISIPTNKFNTLGEEKPITEKQIHDWQDAYPAIDVRRVLAQIRSWVINNPAKRKTASGINRFVDSWLAREQNRGGSHAANQQRDGNVSGSSHGPFSEVVGQQARDVIQRLSGNGVHSDAGCRTVCEDGSIISQ